MMSLKELDSQPPKELIDKREAIIQRLRSEGLRITKQRKLIMDIILNEDCSCSKEIYYQAHSRDSSIGIATVYRMVKTLEEIGAIDRRNLYRVCCEKEECFKGCTILLENSGSIKLSREEWAEVLETGLKHKGFLSGDRVEAVLMN